ncbi:MAG TPA: hypothetical protein VFR28_00330 [Allosphingosinicella sp.]|jgi:hypothetical protein|nr:hypothetical protein [Allosphingosinicella sp.]
MSAQVKIGRRAVVAGMLMSATIAARPARAQRPPKLRWTAEDEERFATFVPAFVSGYDQKIDCADLALVALATFAGRNRLPIRLYDFDLPRNPQFDRKIGSRRWIVFDPRRSDWQAYGRYISDQLGAVNVIENSRRIEMREARAGDLIMSKNEGPGDYTGHTRVLVASRWDSQRNDWWIGRYEGNLPPVVPVLKESYFGEISDVYMGRPRRWSFEDFALA